MNLCFFSDANNLHVRRLTAGLAARGHRVHLVCHKPRDVPGVTVERFSVLPAGLSMPFRWTTRWTRYLQGFLRRFDVVILFFLHDFGFSPEIVADGCFVATPRGSDIVAPPGETPPSVELIERRIALLRQATLIGAACPRFAAIVAEYAGISVENVESLPLGVDLDKFCPDPVAKHAPSQGLRVGFFKGFREVYGAINLVRAMPVVLKELPGTRFDLVGDGPMLKACQDTAVQLGVQSAISWLPRQPHELMPALLRQWHVTAMPSLCESFGLAALESSAMGVPVVASKVGGLPDTVQHGRSGLLVPPGSPDKLAEGLLELLQHEPLRKEMGLFGRSWVARHYDWQKVLTQWESVLTKARDLASVCV